MDIDSCIKRIDRYLLKEDYLQTLLIDVQNRRDLSKLIRHFKVSGNIFKSLSSYCNADELPQMATFFNDLAHIQGRVFVTGLTPFLMLKGKDSLADILVKILETNIVDHLVVITYKCRNFLLNIAADDPRRQQRIHIIDGQAEETPSLVFCSPRLPLPKEIKSISGIDKLGEALENGSSNEYFIETNKTKQMFPDSLYLISDHNKAYDVIQQIDDNPLLHEEYGTEEQWTFALNKIRDKMNWEELIATEFGDHNMLDREFHKYAKYDSNNKWLYFIGLKLFGANNNYCLNQAAQKAISYADLARQIYRSIINVSKDDDNYEKYYILWKTLVSELGDMPTEVQDYCNFVRHKGVDAIYYLTDITMNERELIIELLDEYAVDNFKREELIEILKLVYPALYDYLTPYRFNNSLLDQYFQDYKYQKVINHVFPEFEKIVAEQAVKREYNLLLDPRTSKIESIDITDAKLYFVDAMGVEYLGYVMSLCHHNHLSAKITVCRCELPSITEENKEFISLFRENDILDIKELDQIKHHGKEKEDYQKTKLPIYLIHELEVVKKIIENIRNTLASDQRIKKAIIFADHGASRLAVIHETESETIWKMHNKGEKSGRCCLKTEVDEQPKCATDAGEYWALANYDRFKGGRKANVEVHGGATLEEITVPIIELTYIRGQIEVFILPLNTNIIPDQSDIEIEVSYRKVAAINIFVPSCPNEINIRINDKSYKAVATGNGYYKAEMPDIKREGTYYLDVCSENNILKTQIPLKVKKEGVSKNNLF